MSRLSLSRPSAGLHIGLLALIVQVDPVSEVTHESPCDGPGHTSGLGQTVGNIPDNFGCVKLAGALV